MNIKAEQFHLLITSNRDKHVKQKTTTMTNLDKKWMTPELKTLNREIKREFYTNKKSPRWKEMKKELKKKKRNTILTMHNKFVTDLKTTNPHQFYQMCKKIGAIDQMKSGDLCLRSLVGRSDKECAEAVGEHFAAVSAETQDQPLKLTLKTSSGLRLQWSLQCH